MRAITEVKVHTLFFAQRVVVFPDVHGVVRALHNGKLVVEADGTGTVHEVRPSAVLLEEE